MYIVNRHGIVHSYPEGQPLPNGTRLATERETADWQKADAAGKVARKEQKRQAAADRAQVVVVHDKGSKDE